MADDRSPSKKPANTAFKQQRLKAWQPILTPKTVLPIFFLVGAIFIPLGIGLYIASEKVNQVIFDYTQCKEKATSTLDPPTVGGIGPIEKWQWSSTDQNCRIQFRVPERLGSPVFMYYRLTNFYQNHRRYVKSFSPKQLNGERLQLSDKDMENCKPLLGAKDPEVTKLSAWGDQVVVNGANTTITDDSQIYPCGLIANSMFSDEISPLTCVQSDDKDLPSACDGGTTSYRYDFSAEGIAWPSDRNRFDAPVWRDDADLTVSFVPPPLWRVAWPEKWGPGYTKDNLPDLKKDERFQVWMRTAALPNFRKLYGRSDTTLPAGIWEVTIRDTFDTDRFSGTKSIVLSTTSIIGGKNPFLGIAYLATGVVCWVLGIAFLLRHMVKPRKLGDHTYLSWNQPHAQQRGPMGDHGNERTSLIGGR
ncbi:CDC50/LEM3 family [Gaertneriomyces semiglobifer]|nr:CDC50/LEM3 family [Gaertneriomyces semiglobifer]